MKILFLSRWFPFPPNNGSKIRIYHLLRELSKFHDVALFSFYDPQETSVVPPEQYPFCSEVCLVPWKEFDAKSRRARLGFFNLSPRFLLDTYSPQMEALIRDAVTSQAYDLIIASQLSMASYYPLFGRVPAIFEEVELGVFFDQAFHSDHWVDRFRHKLTWFKLQLYFSRLLDFFAACTVVSEQERQIFIKHFPDVAHKVNVLPNCISLEDYQGLKIDVHQHQMIFTGSFRYKPNYDAMLWFVRSVFPLVLKQISDAKLIITGDHANLPLPGTENIRFAGYVDDIKSLIASCAVSLVPLWSGGGTRLKILEAMAIGTPVVSTSKGAEGLIVQNGKHVLIADQPEVFAENVIKVMCEQDLRDSLSVNALRLVKEHYDWKTVIPKFLVLLDKVVSG
jgi:glycosyltransferase involved in cell wall biosynthesis